MKIMDFLSLDFLIFVVYNTIIAITIAVSLGWFHEYLHIRKAKQLGLVFTRGRRFENKITVNTDDPVKGKQIGDAPYKVIIPIAIVLLIIGISISQLGLIIGAVATLLIHAVTYRLEGRDEVQDSHNI